MGKDKNVTFRIGGRLFSARIVNAEHLRAFVYAAAAIAGFITMESIGHKLNVAFCPNCLENDPERNTLSAFLLAYKREAGAA